MGRSKLKRRGRINEPVLQSDIVLSKNVTISCDILIGVLSPLLKDAYSIGDYASASFCSRLMTDLGALRAMMGELQKEGEFSTDNLVVSVEDDYEFRKFFDDLFIGVEM